MVLAMLVLLSAIVIAFLSSVTTDMAASKSYEGQTNARMLADSAVNLVISKIQEASTTPGVAWISQPGLIRTFNGNHKQAKAYKLYSSDKLVEGETFNPMDGTDLPQDEDWRTQKGLWTDMNSPLFRRDTDASSNSSTLIPVYPIFDANPHDYKTVTDLNDAKAETIVDPDNGKPIVEGFSIKDYDQQRGSEEYPGFMPVKWLYILQDGTLVSATKKTGTSVTLSGGTPENPAVGRIAFWTDDETCKVNLNTASEGTYWDTPIANTMPATMPESVNNGDVSIPVKFDPNLIYEWDLANQLPGSHEYQRYPGHPATTSLSPVLGRFILKKLGLDINALDPLKAQVPPLQPQDRARYIEAINQIAPRITGLQANGDDFSSKGGTVRGGGILKAQQRDVHPIVSDADRLYATPEELVYDTSMKADPSSGSNVRATLIAKPLSKSSSDKVVIDEKEARQLLERSRFFLTTTSKAPEQNIFNQPRISIWPITRANASNDTSNAQANKDKMTPFDKLIAACSTVDDKPFYFDRVWWNGGSGGGPASPDKDWTTRNSQLYSYLEKLTGKSFPGFGSGTFLGKYSDDRDQILTEIVDYVRCTNLVDTSGDVPAFGDSGWSPQISKSYTQPDDFNEGEAEPNGVSNRGQVVPLVPGNGTRGFGRIATICEMTAVVTRKSYDPAGTDVKMQVALIPSLYCPMAGFSALANNIRLKFKNLDNISLTHPKLANGLVASDQTTYPFQGAGEKAEQEMHIESPDGGGGGLMPSIYLNDSKIGGYMGVRALVEMKKDAAGSNFVGTPVDSMFPVGNNAIFTDASSGVNKGNFKAPNPKLNPDPYKDYKDNDQLRLAGKFDVEVWAPASGPSSHLIQTFHFDFPEGNDSLLFKVKNDLAAATDAIPFPTVEEGKGLAGSKKGGTGARYGGPRDWYNGATAYLRGPILNVDSTRSLAPIGGAIGPVSTADLNKGTAPDPKGLDFDMRTLACLADVNTFGGTTVFQPIKIAAAVSDVPSVRFGDNVRNEIGLGSGPGGVMPSSPSATDAYNTSPMPGSFIFGIKGKDFEPVEMDPIDKDMNYKFEPLIPTGIYGVFNSKQQVGDWDNGPSYVGDGSYLGKADEGSAPHFTLQWQTDGSLQDTSKDPPYIGAGFTYESAAVQQNTYFSPNRQIPSPVVFGSLPTGVKRQLPWQTLLFRPAKRYLPGGDNHPGSDLGGAQPPDHLLLDLFWMPVVEPYAISEPFSTAGKINMNYQIAPFTYIQRNTGMRAVLQSTKIIALNPNQATGDGGGRQLKKNYKVMGWMGPGGGGLSGAVQISIRRNVDVTNTLRIFDDKHFGSTTDTNKPFITASEICDIPLVPMDFNSRVLNFASYKPSGGVGIPANANADQIDTKLATFWMADGYSASGNAAASPYTVISTAHNLTGDNSLERPYAQIYPRLTTKSNTYTVHVKVQSLKKASKTVEDATIIDEKKDTVTGEFRGSFVIERYLDSNNQKFNETSDEPLGPYKFRVVSSKQFVQ